MSEREDIINELQRNIEYAPKEPTAVAAGLLGWYARGVFICSRCAGRIIARGCSIPRPCEAIWTDSNRGPAQCVLCHVTPRHITSEEA